MEQKWSLGERLSRAGDKLEITVFWSWQEENGQKMTKGKNGHKYKEDHDRAMLGMSKRSFDEENHVR